MLLEPIVNGVDGATDVAGDLGGRSVRLENTGNDGLTNFGGIADARHK